MEQLISRKTRKKIVRYLLELLVVFVGVYGAFMLNQYQEEKKLTAIRYNYYRGFLEEIRHINWMTGRLQGQVDSIVGFYEAEIQAGKRPPLKMHALDFTTNMFILRSAFDSEHFSSIEMGYVANISAGSNLISILNRKVNMYQEQSRNILYSLPYDPGRFYDTSGMLRPELQWYINDLKEISRYAATLNRAIEFGAVPATEELIQRVHPQE